MLTLRLRDLLTERGLSVDDFREKAKQAGLPMSRSTAFRLASNDWKSISRRNLEAICKVLKVKPGDVFVSVRGSTDVAA